MNCFKFKVSSAFARNFSFLFCLSLYLFSGAFDAKLRANSIDSLLQVLSKVKSTDQSKILNEIADFYISEKIDTAPNSSNEYIGFQKLKSEVKAELYLLVGEKYINISQFSKALFYLEKSLNDFQLNENQIGIAKAKSDLALVLTELSDLDLAIGLLMDAIPAFQEYNQIGLEGDAWIKLANIYFNVGEFKDAKTYYNNALKIWVKQADSIKTAQAYYFLARVHLKIDDYNRAITFNDESLKINEKLKNSEGIILSHFLSGEIFELLKEFTKAETYYSKSLELSKKTYNRLYIAKTCNNLAKIYILKNDLNKARAYLTESMIAADFINSSEILIEVYQNLSTVYEHEKVYDEALQYYKEYTELKDSVFSEKQYHKIAQTKLNLDNQAKSKIIQRLEEDTFYKNKALKKQRYFLWVSLFSIFLFIMLIVLVNIQSRRRKILNEELERQKNKAEEADFLKSAFLANMSHEIRSPMNAIIGFSNLITDSFTLDNEIVKYMSYIKLSGSNLLQLVDDIIDIAKIEADQLKIRKENFELDEMFHKLYTTTLAGIANKKPETKIQLKLPSNSDKPIIFSDELRIKQVLTNFISNAVKFTDKGLIEFGYEKLSDSELLFFTRDTGLGIPNKDKELIFQRFGQVEDSYTRNTAGTGLGLAICKSIVELLGGEIWVDSLENKGSTFYFKIPIEYKGVSQSNVSQNVTPLNQIDWKGKSILIVEDDDMNFKLIHAILEKTNIEITRALDGHESINIVFSATKIDMVLMDIQLPIINGYEAIKIMRKKSTIPIIAVTAYAMPGEKEKCIEAGSNDYISKPYNINELLNKIAKLIH